jgi:hypothetical protein
MGRVAGVVRMVRFRAVAGVGICARDTEAQSRVAATTRAVRSIRKALTVYWMRNTV